MRARHAAAGLALLLSLTGCATTATAPASDLVAGETVRTYARPGATLRDAEHRDTQRVTLWYPAAAGSVATARVIGPADGPYFISGNAADEAEWGGAGRLPLVVVSHGFGGSARQMAWLGEALARRGYVVAAVDHPGNNGTDDRTPQGALLYWERTEDLRYALDAVLADPVWDARVDPGRIGAIGYSMGGASVLIELGGRTDPNFCRPESANALCAPTVSDGDYATVSRADILSATPEIRASVATEGADRTDPRIDAAVLIAPGLGPLFEERSLRAIRTPVLILQGDADTVTFPDANARRIAGLLPNDLLIMMPGVEHNDFLGLCGEAGRARYARLCGGTVPREDTHARAIEAVADFFADALSARAAGR